MVIGIGVTSMSVLKLFIIVLLLCYSNFDSITLIQCFGICE